MDPELPKSDDAALRWVTDAASQGGDPVIERSHSTVSLSTGGAPGPGSLCAVQSIVVKRMLRLWIRTFDFAEAVSGHLTVSVAGGLLAGFPKRDAPHAEPRMPASPSRTKTLVLSPAELYAHGVELHERLYAHEGAGRGDASPLRSAVRAISGKGPMEPRGETRALRGILGRFQVLTELLDGNPSARARWEQARDKELFVGMRLPDHAVPKSWLAGAAAAARPAASDTPSPCHRSPHCRGRASRASRMSPLYPAPATAPQPRQRMRVQGLEQAAAAELQRSQLGQLEQVDWRSGTGAAATGAAGAGAAAVPRRLDFGGAADA